MATTGGIETEVAEPSGYGSQPILPPLPLGADESGVVSEPSGAAELQEAVAKIPDAVRKKFAERFGGTFVAVVPWDREEK